MQGIILSVSTCEKRDDLHRLVNTDAYNFKIILL